MNMVESYVTSHSNLSSFDGREAGIGTQRTPSHLISLDDLSTQEIEAIFQRTDEMRVHLSQRKPVKTLENKIVALFFLEPSTRTFLSFQAATQRLGGTTISNDETSLAKGESINDTLRIISGYADLIVLRYSSEGTREYVQDLMTPVINAGDGGNEHPTQALIDLYTIRQRVGRLDGLTVGVGFDPLHSRSIRSFCLALSMYQNNTVVLVSPSACAMTEEQRQELMDRGLVVHESNDINKLLDCKIVYLNRFQHERYADPSEVEEYRNLYRLMEPEVRNSKIAHILDPLPRVGEVDSKVDGLSQAAYFQQSDNGIPIRMALLEKMLSWDGI